MVFPADYESINNLLEIQRDSSGNYKYREKEW